MAKDSIPTSRARRTAKVGGLVGGQAARAAATRAANVARPPDKRREALERRQLAAAEQALEVLGQMKGLALKVGQIASFMDTGALPPEMRDRVQEKLAELRDSAPRVPFDRMRRVIEDDLDEPLEEAFAEFDTDAVAAASIGQVYRARLHDGREVAVKVQYPGVAEAVRSDLQNLSLILRVAKRMAPGMDAKAMAEELTRRLGDELDYELEAQSQRTFARSWRGHPFVVVPDVVTSLSRERVLVTEYVRGARFEEVQRLPQADRDRFGEILFRFFFGCLYRLGHFSGDPHPGNYFLLDDGRVAFLDFGMAKRLRREAVAAEIGGIRRALEGDAAGVYAAMCELGYYRPDDPAVDPDRVLAQFYAAAGWYIEDRELTIDPDYVRSVMINAGGPRSEYWDLQRRATLPPDGMLARRMEVLMLGVLGQLGARANWHRIAREWLLRDAPATPLGEAEAAFFAARGIVPPEPEDERRAA
jgi:predicted unusual protein kinase regulating ubiquinone biosynthesis (AarF/ABC1/UbiB family)